MCEYCDTEDVTEDILIEKVPVFNQNILFEVFLKGSTLKLCSGQNYEKPIIKREIKFCPMCGRKLD